MHRALLAFYLVFTTASGGKHYQHHFLFTNKWNEGLEGLNNLCMVTYVGSVEHMSQCTRTVGHIIKILKFSYSSGYVVITSPPESLPTQKTPPRLPHDQPTTEGLGQRGFFLWVQCLLSLVSLSAGPGAHVLLLITGCRWLSWHTPHRAGRSPLSLTILEENVWIGVRRLQVYKLLLVFLHQQLLLGGAGRLPCH